MKFLIENQQYQLIRGYTHCVSCPFDQITGQCGNVAGQYYDCFAFKLIQSTLISTIFKL
jgi:hypothetical protein